MFSRERKLELMDHLMWDYANIPPEHCLEVLEGKRQYAGHYDEAKLFRKLLESYRWYTILGLLPLPRIYELLNDKVIQSLRFQSLKTRYEFIRDRIQKFV